MDRVGSFPVRLRGDLVSASGEFRGRQWGVSTVRAQGLARDPASLLTIVPRLSALSPDDELVAATRGEDRSVEATGRQFVQDEGDAA